MKQTALDWFFDNLKSHFEHDGDLLEGVKMSFELAKEIEKQQIIDAYKSGINCISDQDADFYYTINYKHFYPIK
jgi:hypothetical protein